MRILRTLLLLITCGTSAAAPSIAIIIDDLGYEKSAGLRALDLHGPVSYAVLPSTPQGKMLAQKAHNRGRDVLLHLPLQSLVEPEEAEPGGISLEMSRGQFADMFAQNLKSVPGAIGVNSHRGSLLTQHPGHMSWLMEELRSHGSLFFVDSYTTQHSVALDIATEAGVAAVRRDVFLDSTRSKQHVLAEFERLKALAVKKGSAVAIGHPYPETLAVLEQELPKLPQQGIELVSISELVSRTAGSRRSAGGIQ